MSKANGNSGANSEPELIEQPHGGALLSGGVPGHKGGPGRPNSFVRARMREMLEGNLHVAQDIVDDPDTSDSDRLRALDFLAKYGIGTKQEVTGKDDGPIEFEEAGSARERIAGRLGRFTTAK